MNKKEIVKIAIKAVTASLEEYFIKFAALEEIEKQNTLLNKIGITGEVDKGYYEIIDHDGEYCWPVSTLALESILRMEDIKNNGEEQATEIVKNMCTELLHDLTNSRAPETNLYIRQPFNLVFYKDLHTLYYTIAVYTRVVEVPKNHDREVKVNNFKGLRRNGNRSTLKDITT